jgi:nitroimidazol reductase NimA-like FMN-containing flavoprotein (pyridoxamine 5'-phosphate oxidase superfamily)
MMFIQEMSESDCFTALTRTRLGRLACAHENQPYVVPIYFVYEEPYVYGFTTLGQKVEWMRSNPLVCVELDEVVNFDQWTSILLFGTYEELPEVPGTPEFDQEQRRAREPWQAMDRQTSVSSPPGQQVRLHAHELLQEHRVPWWQPGSASATHRHPRQPSPSIFYRIRIDRITGRRATHTPGGPVGSRTSPVARGRQGLVRRVFQALSKLFASWGGMEK